MKFYFTQIDPPDPDIVARLAEKGWQAVHLPFRRVVLAPPAPELRWSDFDLLVISSKQGARWLARYGDLDLPPIAAVGGSTHRLLGRWCGNLPFATDPPVHAADLVDRVRQRFPNLGTRILFLHGAVHRPDIPEGLAGYHVSSLQVYHTENLSQDFPPIDHSGVVYFQAPSTALDYHSIYRQPPRRIAVIGPTTAKAVKQLGWHIDFQPARPEASYMVEALPSPDSWEVGDSPERNTRFEHRGSETSRRSEENGNK
ncbi:Uroporphyrinogen-III synthase [Sulfidibacter corallicola]|uniref:Uroporphyrinogen-III synthase n=1 Tax=Sulfidibacter corallicola TaxID=2818388 RepID=A0A8A4TVU1_SULCO|nr:uroporphyrinogen-III synthase [Sulfidibacter corallicola]QTD54076.1 uroporphyrinogen-III synthase [Sulfidibacter corallicola]